MPNSIPADILVLFEKLIKTNSKITMKGATIPYTSHNGHMFSFLDKDGNLGLRLPTEERDAFIARFKTRLCEAHGTVLKEYVLVPEKLFRKTVELKSYFSMSFDYVSNLKPKATKK